MNEQEIRQQIENGTVNWEYISECQTLSESFIREFTDKVDWNYISKHQTLSESFIREFADRVNWDYISACQTLSEDFIREFADNVSSYYISEYQILSEDFIREFADNVSWNYISECQILSESFIREFADMVDWECISERQILSEDFRREFNITISENNWLYVDKETKRQAIQDCGLYEINGDCVIAYKGVKRNGESKFKRGLFYEVGKSYKAHANHNLGYENSFGLSAWTLEKAKDYCDEKVFKVSIHLDNIAALVHNGYKIRAKELTILEEIV